MPTLLKSVPRPDASPEPPNLAVPDRDKLDHGLSLLFAVHVAPLLSRLAALEAENAVLRQDAAQG